MHLLPLILLLFLCACNSSENTPATDEGHADSSRITAEAFGSIDTTLHDSLRAIELRSGGTLGVAAIHLESGWRTSYRGRETFPMASVAKLPMAIQFLRMADAGAFRLDSAVRLRSADHRPGPSRLYHRIMREGGATTLHTLLEAMVASSDNTASDYILRLAGGPKQADRLMDSLGLPSIDITHYEGELILLWGGVDPGTTDSSWTRDQFYARIQEAGDTAWRLAAERLADAPEDAATPEESALLLSMLHRRKLLSPVATDTLLAIMSRASTGRGRIPGLLPVGTMVAHKTGTISSTTNDIGIVTLPGGRGHLVIAVYVKGSRVGVRGREQAIAAVAGLVYREVMKR